MKIELKRVLVPIDFSERSRAALVYGLALVEQFGGSLHLLHVIEEVGGVEPLALPERKAVELRIEERVWAELKSLLPDHDERWVRPVLALEWGEPSVEILRYERAHAIDLIAIGAHRHNGFRPVPESSTADKVVREASCPVLAVRRPERSSPDS
jgi:nucleotide-binding universal stress UspA family protein